ncbi:glycosyltransferase family 9 protein [Amycolatopsis magusensis]|uniref:glycosyltransferase family 9 protein n=1 Tax=Amycolatopsis magusensis TaxID=882444 RepID=UPI0037979E6C
MSGRVLVVRSDNLGDVLLAGPAVRAVAAGADEVTFLAGPRGRAAAELLPGVDRVLEWCAPWIDPEPPAITAADMTAFRDRIREVRADRALIFTSFHQSPLPMALALREAGVGWIGAISEDYPGALLDLRHRIEGDGDIPEPERARSLAEAAGFRLPPGDDGKLAITGPLPDVSALTGEPGYVVVHPAATAPAREWGVDQYAAAVRSLVDHGYRVVVTGGPADAELTRRITCPGALDLTGRTDLRGLAAVLAGAAVVVAPNTGPAHLAAAVRTPVVSLFAPVVPAARWAPYGVPVVLLGDQAAACRDSRARHCPIDGHPCLNRVDVEEVLDAVRRLRATESIELEHSGGAA